MEYRIVLNRMEFRAFHGCYDLEQQVGNRFTVDLEITAELGEVASEDCVEKAVNYLLVYETVREQMRVTQRTIERVSMNIMDALYARFDEVADESSFHRESIRKKLLPLVRVAQTLAQKYDVVVTNPPYMGASKARGIDSSRFIFLPDGIITTARKRSVRNTLPSLLLLREPSTPFAARKFPTP